MFFFSSRYSNESIESSTIFQYVFHDYNPIHTGYKRPYEDADVSHSIVRVFEKKKKTQKILRNPTRLTVYFTVENTKNFLKKSALKHT